jgi:serine/threonine protein kinase
LGFLHQNNIVHRDLKPDNILIEEKEDKVFLKIGDFGLSKQSAKDSYLNSCVGTILYMAPEITKNRPYKGYLADIFSLGCLFYYMLFLKEKSFYLKVQINETEVHRNIEMKMKGLSFYNSERLGKLIINMLKFNPNERKETIQVLDCLNEMKRDYIKSLNIVEQEKTEEKEERVPLSPSIEDFEEFKTKPQVFKEKKMKKKQNFNIQVEDDFNLNSMYIENELDIPKPPNIDLFNVYKKEKRFNSKIKN